MATPIWHPDTDISFIGSKLAIRNRHLMAFLMFLATILLIIQVSGCTQAASSSPDIYLVELKYASFTSSSTLSQNSGVVNTAAYTALNNYVNTTSMNARVGYFGVCISDYVSSTEPSWYCSRNATKLADEIKDAVNDPLNLVYLLHSLSGSLSGLWLAIISIIFAFFTLLALCLSKVVYFIDFRVIFALCLISHTSLLLSMVWLQSFCMTLKHTVFRFSAKSVQTSVGKTALSLGWAGYVFVALCLLWLWVILLKQPVTLLEEEEKHEAHGHHEGGRSSEHTRHGRSHSESGHDYRHDYESHGHEHGHEKHHGDNGHSHYETLHRHNSDSTVNSWTDRRMPGYFGY